MFRGVLFDVDGVLLDSAAAHTVLWSNWANLHELDVEALLAGIPGERGIDTVRRAAPHLEPNEELELIRELWAEASAAVAAFPGALALLNELPATAWGLVTSGPRDSMIQRFEHLGLPLPPVVVCGEDVRHGKPHPEPYERGCALLALQPSDCVVIEDAPAGIASARAAGCYVVGVGRLALETAEADESHADLLSVSERIRELLQL